MNSNTSSLKEAIDELLRAFKLSGKIDEYRLVSSWESIMGKMIAQHTKEISINQGVLTIRLDSAVLREELAFSKTKIISLLNDTIGKKVIKEVIVK